MANSMATTVFPWDGRDQEDQAEVRYNAPLRHEIQHLVNENMHLKRLLREAGIPWSDQVASHSAFQAAPNNHHHTRPFRRRSSRLSALDHVSHKLPYLPVEILLRICQYSLLAKDPIIDPLSKSIPETLTVQEAKRDPQVAIGFLATCRAFHVEGTRFFWTKNVFTFTSPETLRRFADLSEPLRLTVRHIALRIIARYYDDEQRAHKVTSDYHPSFANKSRPLQVIQRHREPDSLSRPGFVSRQPSFYSAAVLPLLTSNQRCYAWTQTSDFLDALRAPFDPTRPKSTVGPRARLLPNLTSMRIDFVNFPESFLPLPDPSLHEMAAHEMGYTLNELVITGLPTCEVGHSAGHDLQGMLKDDGLYIVHEPAYFQQKRSLKPFRELPGLGRVQVVRSYGKRFKSKTKDKGHVFPVAPEETGHPKSTWKRRKTLWKRVPLSRDAEERKWVEFDRHTGEDVNELYDDSDEDVCPNCGIIHSMTSDAGASDYDSDDSDDSM